MFFTHFASKNQLPGFYIRGKLTGNGLENLIHENNKERTSRFHLI